MNWLEAEERTKQITKEEKLKNTLALFFTIILGLFATLLIIGTIILMIKG